MVRKRGASPMRPRATRRHANTGSAAGTLAHIQPARPLRHGLRINGGAHTRVAPPLLRRCLIEYTVARYYNMVLESESRQKIESARGGKWPETLTQFVAMVSESPRKANTTLFTKSAVGADEDIAKAFFYKACLKLNGSSALQSSD
mmetsp:Transcript_33919/g.88517  ORF Transcript_33919/g.88517 Transcript_33919/m.88517 type:complete len:146 (-) Transcript_33919:245-682(-)